MPKYGAGDLGMLSVQINVAEFQRAKKAIAMANNKGTYRGMFRDEIRNDLEDLRNYAAGITHRESGNLASSHMWTYDSHRMVGRLFINPRHAWATGSTVRWPRIYGIYEHARGGSHAFYERTMRERAPSVVPDGLRTAVRRLPWP